MKVTTFAAGILIAAAVLFLTGADGTQPQSSTVQYAVYTDNNVLVSWQSPQQTVTVSKSSRQVTDNNIDAMTELARQMNIPLSGDSCTTYDLLNHVGKSGWKLVTCLKDSGTTLYFERTTSPGLTR